MFEEYAETEGTNEPLFPVFEPPKTPVQEALEKIEATQAAVDQLMLDIKPKRVSRKHKLTRSYLRVELIADLAGGMSINDCAAKYRVSPSTVSTFKQHFAFEIEAKAKHITDGLESNTTQLWIAEKTNRLAVYQEQVEVIDEQMQRDDGKNRRPDAALLRTQQAALRGAAEELGQLRTHVEVDQKIVHSVINGVNPEDLK